MASPSGSMRQHPSVKARLVADLSRSQCTSNSVRCPSGLLHWRVQECSFYQSKENLPTQQSVVQIKFLWPLECLKKQTKIKHAQIVCSFTVFFLLLKPVSGSLRVPVDVAALHLQPVPCLSLPALPVGCSLERLLPCLLFLSSVCCLPVSFGL